MLGLSSTRVIVVDDNIKEALPVIKALSKINIGTAYFDGNNKDFPDKNHLLRGIRLAILDMDLVDGGSNDKSKVSALVNTISKILSSENGPYAVVAWTKYPYLLKVFENDIFREESIPNPVISISMEKSDAKDNKGNFDVKIIADALTKKIQNISPLLILQSWEEQSIYSAIEVINFLSQLAIQPNCNDLKAWRDGWKKKILELMHAIAYEEAGKKLENKSSIQSIFNAFIPLQADRLDVNSGTLSKELVSYSRDIIKANRTTILEDRVKLNSMFHIASTNLEPIAPGNIYIINPYLKRPDWIPARKTLYNDLMQKNKKLDPNDKRKIRQVVIEISPDCDHAQKKIRMARLLPGFLVPENLKDYFKKPCESIYRNGPFYLSQIPGKDKFYLYLSANNFFTARLENLETLNPTIRLRNQSLEHLINHFTNHASRPGLLLIHDQ